MPTQPTSRKRTQSAIAFAVVCALGLALNIWIAVQNSPGWGIDFNQFYAAGRLAGTGHVYDWDALRKLQAENGIEMPTGRLPVVLYGHGILGSLPYAAARSLWLGVSIAALLAFAVLWPGAPRLPMLAALAWSLPATMVLVFGQDIPFWLMFFAAGLLLLKKERPWLAGVAFALCICKFHLALGIPVMLAAQKRWKTLIAGVAAVVVLIAACFFIEGPAWPLEYVKMSRMPEFSPAPERMPNLYGVLSWLSPNLALELAGAVLIVLLLWAACRAGSGIGMAGAAAAACGLLLGHHSYSGDCTLLIPLSVLTLGGQESPPWLKAWAIFMLSPAPVLLIVSQNPLPGQLLIAAFVVAAVVAASRLGLVRGIYRRSTPASLSTGSRTGSIRSAPHTSS